MKTTFSKIANKQQQQPNKLNLITKSTIENSGCITTSDTNAIGNRYNNNNQTPSITQINTNANNSTNNAFHVHQPQHQHQQHWYSDSQINNIIENDGYYSTERSTNSYRDGDEDDDDEEEYDVEIDDEEEEDEDVEIDGIDTDELLFSDYHGGTSQSMEQQQQMPSISTTNNDYDSLMVSSINPKVRSNTQEQQPHYYQLALNMSVASTTTDQSSNADCYYRYNDDSINNWSMRLSQMTNGGVGGGAAYLQATARHFHHHHHHHHHKQHRSLSQSQCHSPSPPSTTTSNSQTTTSWGKLKHSKSMNQQQLTQQQHSQQQNQHQPRRATKKRMLRTQTEPCSIQQTQSPSLFQLYSRTKLSKSPTVTFGELKNRKKFSENEQSQSIIDASYLKQANLTVKTDNKTPIKNKKISIGTQYPPYLMDQSIQTSTIHTATSSQTRYHKVNAALQTDLLRPPSPPSLALAVPQSIKVPVPVSQAKLKQTMKKLFFKSLPDLTFLDAYSDNKTTEKATIVQQQQPNDNTNNDQSNNLLLLNSCSSSFDNKRKTLKSIKRYRQTKQVTEPLQIPQPIINTPPPPPTTTAKPTTTAQQTQTPTVTTKIRTSESFSVKTTTTTTTAQQTKQQKSNSTNSSSSSSSSGYISSKAQITSVPVMQTTATSPIPTIQTPITQSNNQQGTQLKSCLKRKDSASFSSASNSSELTSHPTSIIFKRNSIQQQQQSSTQMLPVHLKYLFLNNTELKFDLKAMSIHIPSVGWLFTCDGKSLKRYSYYKKLCKYKINNEQVLHEVDEKESGSGGGTTSGGAGALDDEVDDEDDNDEDIEGDDEEEDEEDDRVDNATNKQTSFDETKLRTHQNYGSDNDIKQQQQQLKTQSQPIHHSAQRCVSFSERILHHTFVPSQQSSPIHHQQASTNSRRLQYDTLIEMLKKANNMHLNQTKIRRSLSNRCPPTATTASATSTRIQTNRAIVTQLSSDKAQQITASTQQNVFIDADSISLASLSESPPNEFKFSDYEEDDDNNQEREDNQQLIADSDIDKLVPPIKATIKQTPNDANVIDLCSNVQSNQKQIKEKLARLKQQQQQQQQTTVKINPLINDFKIILFQLKEIYLKEQVLNNEKNQFIDKLLRENVCKIVYDLLKDNLKIICNEPIIKTSINSQIKLDELRLEQLCKLFQYAIKNMLSSNSANNKQTIDDLFVFNEASSLQKYEAFIYFLLNTKQLANLVDYINTDRQLIEKYYDLSSPSTSINTNSSSLQTSQMFLFTNKYNFDEFMKQLKQLNQLKFDLKYYFYKAKSFHKSPAPPPPPQLLPAPIPPPPPSSSSSLQSIQPVPPPPPRGVVIPKPLNAQQTNFQYTGNTTNNHLIKPQKQQTPPPPLSSTQPSSPSQTSNSSVGFNFKSISKKFNIKSWFTNSKHQQQSHQQHHQQQLQQQQQQQKSTNDLMKHSFSEPLINDYTTNIDYHNQKSQNNNNTNKK